MFLGSSRRWWIAAAILFVGGVFFISSETGGTLGNIGGVLFVFAAMAIIAAAPMRYGRAAHRPTAESPAPAPETAPAAPSQPRPRIEAGDASEV